VFTRARHWSQFRGVVSPPLNPQSAGPPFFCCPWLLTEYIDRSAKGKIFPGLLIFYLRAPRHEGVLGSGGIAPRIFDLGTRWRWVVSFTLRLLYPQVKSPWIGGWVGSRAGLDAVVKTKIPSACRDSNPWPSNPSISGDHLLQPQSEDAWKEHPAFIRLSLFSYFSRSIF
jgi:hypothetical protein